MNNSQENPQAETKFRKKTGPSPKYGPNEAKRMVSMRLSPSALNSIKDAAERVFRDSQADVIERVMRIFPTTTFEKIENLSKIYNMEGSEILEQALDLFEAKKKTAVKS